MGTVMIEITGEPTNVRVVADRVRFITFCEYGIECAVSGTPGCTVVSVDEDSDAVVVSYYDYVDFAKWSREYGVTITVNGKNVTDTF